jgi:ATP-dependent Clp protease protease subunit
MRRIEIRGVIVPSHLDSEWLRDYIDKGMITPESRVRAALKEAGKEPVELYINSPGGSVFAGYEIANAVNEYLAAGGAVEITLGAMAASAAANIVAAVPAAKVRAHANTKIMYHGAAGYTEGGAEAHADTADLLARVNGEVQKALTTRYKLDAATVAEWFAEGRQGWLDARQAKAAGLVDEIIEETAPLLKFRPADAAAFAEHGIAIAACAVDAEPPAVSQAGAPTAEAPEVPGPATEAPKPETETEATSEAETILALRLDMEQARADAAARLAEVEKLHAEALAKRDKTLSDYQSRADKADATAKTATEQLATATATHAEALAALTTKHAAKLAELTARLDKLTAGFRYAEDAEVGTWAQALESCGADYVEARRKFPTIYSAFMEAARKQHPKRRE